jgi:MSHA biogenesis protein MshO
MAMSPNNAHGFTLIELIVAMSVSVILIGFMALFMTGPVDMFLAQGRRAELTDAGDAVWQHVARDVRGALPNSARSTSNGTFVALEMLAVTDAARYLYDPAVPPPSPTHLDFGIADQDFRTSGAFQSVAAPPFNSTAYYLAVNNLGTPGADAYAFTNVMTPKGTQIVTTLAAGEDQVKLTPGFTFNPAPGSAMHRMYLVSGPVTYLCDLAAGTVRRYSGYTIAANQAAVNTAAKLNAAGAVSSLIAQNVTACSFRQSPGTNDHGGIVTMSLAVSGQGESMTLMHQMRVENPS